MSLKDNVLGLLGMKKGVVLQKPSEMQVGVLKNKIEIIFPEPITSVEFDKLQALTLIETLTSKLSAIKK